MKLLFITDYTEQFAYRLLRGIIDYSSNTEPWVVCKMPADYKRQLGIKGVVKWALKWKADVVIGQFSPDDDVTLFRKNGIVALAQDYINKFDTIPNITADYQRTGEMAADHFLSRGFQHFGFFGYNGVCWSDERRDGFLGRLRQAGYKGKFHVYDRQHIDNLWYYEQAGLSEWIKSLPKPIAIMACDDNQGNILLEACNSCGVKIPYDVAIIGVDNDEVLCNLSDPSLSTINVGIERGGYEAAAMAEKMVRDPSFEGGDIVLHPLNIVSRLSTSVFATKDQIVFNALQFIHANIDRHIDVSDVLEYIPMSRRLLEQRFKAATGETIYKYIIAQRMERFAQLLISTNDPVSEIAMKLDEPDTKSIARRFKAIKGCTPSDFRKKELRKLGV